MSDGFIGLFNVPDEGVAVPVVSVNPTVVASEVVDAQAQKSGNSKVQFDFSLTQLTAGAIHSISVEQRESAQLASNLLTFGGANTTTNVNDGDTATVNGRVYTFKNTLSAIDQVKIGVNVLETIKNFVKTINLTGVAGTNYYAGQTIHATVQAVLGYRDVLLQAKTGGTAGNAYGLTSTGSTRCVAMSATFAGGTVAGAWGSLGTLKAVKSDGTSGWQGTSLNSMTGILGPVKNTTNGFRHDFKLRYFNADGQVAVDATPAEISTTITGTVFNGRNDLLEYYEVSGLIAISAQVPEGNNGVGSPTPLSPSGKLKLSWDDMTQFDALIAQPKSSPSTAGTPTQDTKDLNVSELSKISEYVVYMYIATASALPERKWPRPTDANGIWYLVARTKDNFIEISCPKNKNIALWVGFGSAGTAINTVTPIESKYTYTIEQGS